MDKKRKIILIVFLLVIASATGIFCLLRRNKPLLGSKNFSVPIINPSINQSVKTPPAPVSMNRLKAQGCVADGLLSQYDPDSDQFVALINRSNCYYLHRAIETWLTPPDFAQAQSVMNQITKKDVVYGMFIAEAINERADYTNADTGHVFNFKAIFFI